LDFVKSFKSGQVVDISDSLKVFFFDVIFKIIFGKNAYDQLNDIDYLDPFLKGKIV